MEDNVDEGDESERRFLDLCDTVDDILRHTPPEANRLLAIYSRFEYALKKRSRINENDRRTYAEDNNGQVRILLTDYVRDVVADDFLDRMQAFENERYVATQPAKRWTVGDGWLDHAPVTDNISLFKAVRQIRNNLFHGNKFRMLTDEGHERDIKLLQGSASILLRAVQEDETLYNDFIQ
ncbi:hypothetical protein [Stappia sp.]|uniref:hypothetical protein n=1 Tax=Stappia sp. TaxID=1870903 RepID=UPI003C7E2F0F